MNVARLIAAAAVFAMAWPAHGQEGPTQAVRLCENLTLYASDVEPGGLWRNIRLEDARRAPAITYTAASARLGELRGAPAVLLQQGRAQVGGQPLSFDEYVLPSCPEAALHTPN
jgi:hypothetical protein